jgi:hypothetical protein
VNNFCFASYCIRPHPRLPARPKPADQASSSFTTYLKNKGKTKENRRPLTHLPPSLSLLLRPALSSLRVPRSFFHFSLSSYILHTAELRPWHLLPARWSSSEYVLRLTEWCFVVVLHQPTKPPLSSLSSVLQAVAPTYCPNFAGARWSMMSIIGSWPIDSGSGPMELIESDSILPVSVP